MKTDINNSRLFSLASAGLLIGIGLYLLGLCMKSGIDDFAHRDRIVTVRGLAQRDLPANKVTWPIVCKLTGDDLKALYTQVQSIDSTITGFLKNNGITDSEINVNPPAVTDLKADQYNAANAPYHYSVATVVTVTSSRVDLVQKLMSRQTELMAQGIAVTAGDYNYPTLYEYTDLNTIKPAMIAEATQNARKAADKFAEDSQSKLGKIKTASQGQFSIENRDQYTPQIKTIRVVSTIQYYLKD